MSWSRIPTADLPRFRAACDAAAQTLSFVGAQLQPGMTTADIDSLVREDTRRRGGVPSQLGYHGFPAAVCTSVNEVVCHGIPSPRVRLAQGDLINVDVTTYLEGYHGDTSATFVVGGATSAEAERVRRVARECLERGIAEVRPGARLGDLGAAIEAHARSAGCSVVRDFGGHGIGRVMHAAPHIAHFGQRGRGQRIVSGMAFTIEPMVNLGRPDVVCDADGWTIRTKDGSLSAQFEHTLLVTDQGCDVLTALR